jgi:hypothetical protein
VPQDPQPGLPQLRAGSDAELVEQEPLHPPVRPPGAVDPAPGTGRRAAGAGQAGLRPKRKTFAGSYACFAALMTESAEPE